LLAHCNEYRNRTRLKAWAGFFIAIAAGDNPAVYKIHIDFYGFGIPQDRIFNDLEYLDLVLCNSPPGGAGVGCCAAIDANPLSSLSDGTNSCGMGALITLPLFIWRSKRWPRMLHSPLDRFAQLAEQ
jgi:hypothetical protein